MVKNLALDQDEAAHRGAVAVEHDRGVRRSSSVAGR